MWGCVALGRMPAPVWQLFTSPLELQRKTQTTRVYYSSTREAGASKMRWLQLIDLHFPVRKEVCRDLRGCELPVPRAPDPRETGALFAPWVGWGGSVGMPLL